MISNDTTCWTTVVFRFLNKCRMGIVPDSDIYFRAIATRSVMVWVWNFAPQCNSIPRITMDITEHCQIAMITVKLPKTPTSTRAAKSNAYRNPGLPKTSRTSLGVVCIVIHRNSY